tara:strand:- start:800 stop:1129 length:330 start_codon:yes stop_codon:yes gene_type:complete
MVRLLLPKVGDIITFSGKWNLNLDAGSPSPCGVVVKINMYNSESLELFGLDGELFGTLAYPVAFDHESNQLSKVYVVEWATENKTLKDSYKCINEEWFYNGVFLILSRA